MDPTSKKPTGGYLAGMLLAFTTWSVLPFRTEDWDRGKKHALSFLPIVGAFLGILFWLWTQLALRIGINRVPFALLSLALVLIYTGGIHIDGYMDVADAVASHKEKQAKLAILSDPHVGAFAVIKLIVWLLIYVALLHELHYTQYLFVAAGFILSRMAAVITTKVVKPAKQTGMLASLASNHKRLWIDSAIFLAVLIVIGIFYLWEALALVLLSILAVIWYRSFSERQFGGITGDTTGFFIVIYETLVLLSAALVTWIA
ncbi:MAG TPA: adenosylcobinamide-GDP ribazoletransferase [Fastidiosipila sp.]|nr:adenosylcobinamide-GDP ribazoletransferase [Fastidiosipila sp.]